MPDTDGALSEGFKTTVFPVMSEYGVDHSEIMNGKLNGVIDTHTPCHISQPIL